MYDTLNRLSTLTNSATGQFGFGYDALSRRTSLTRPNGVNTNYTYDNLSRLLSVLHQNGPTTIDGATYTLDNAGNRTSKVNQLNGVTENYTYDPIYQLTQVQQIVSGNSSTSESYTYDAVGNRLSALNVASYTYNNSNQLTSSADGFSYTYDFNGNTLTKSISSGTTQYAWDFENQLASVTLPSGGGVVTFKYDPFGRRILKSGISGTTIYLFEGSNSTEELDSNGTVQTHYAQSFAIDEPLARLRNGTISYYEPDGLGSVTSITNAGGSPAQTYTFSAFGEQTSSTGSLVNTVRFTARDVDSETGLQFSRARYYAPEIGRFVSEDSWRFLTGINLYSYVANDPTGLIDPTGHQQQTPSSGQPVYDPGNWNLPQHVHTNNCYSYACDRLHPPGFPHAPQPGEDSGHPLDPSAMLTCEAVMAAAESDGLTNAAGGPCPCKYHRVLLVIGYHVHNPRFPLRDLGQDYHWYREDSNGDWSSKHGLAPVGPQVKDPNQDAQSWGYTKKCGTMCAPNQ